MKKIKGAAVHVGAIYQANYFKHVGDILNAPVLMSKSKGKHGSVIPLSGKSGFADYVSKNRINYIVTGSPSGANPTYSIPCCAAANSDSKKLIWIWHSYLIEKERHKFACPQFHGQYSVMPEYFYSVFGLEKSEKHFSYSGHFKSLFHYDNPPVSDQEETALFLPDVNTPIQEVVDAISNINCRVMIRPHPGEYTGDSMGRENGWAKNNVDVYKKVFGPENICSRQENILESIDKSKFVFSNYCSSVLIESSVRSELYGLDKLVAVTNGSTILHRKAGINFNKSPKISDFGSINPEILRQCCLQEEEISANFLMAISDALDSEILTDGQTKEIERKFKI